MMRHFLDPLLLALSSAIRAAEARAAARGAAAEVSGVALPPAVEAAGALARWQAFENVWPWPIEGAASAKALAQRAFFKIAPGDQVHAISRLPIYLHECKIRNHALTTPKAWLLGELWRAIDLDRIAARADRQSTPANDGRAQCRDRSPMCGAGN